jgi:hypothetical protein
VADSTQQLMHANLLEVFNERDAEKRRAAIDRTYAEDVRWVDDEGETVGRAALDAKCVGLQTGLGPLQFEAVGPVHALNGFGHLAWRLVDPDGQPQMAGFDAALIEGGLITVLYTVLTPPTP